MTKRTLVFRGEAWAPANDEEGEELVPSHVNYVWTEDDEFYYANVKENFDRAIPLDQLKGKHIPKERVYARIDPGLTIAPEPLPRDVHMKTLTFAFTDEDAEKHTCMGDALLAEAKVYEILKQHPHPNIARYYGCVSKSGYLTGLALKKYKKSLADLVREGYGFTKDEITQLVDTLHSAVRHLHALGLAHVSLEPVMHAHP
jgi:serine/threonine protein kinase